MTQYWGGTRYFFLLALYNFKNIGRGGGKARAPHPTPRSLVLSMFSNLFDTFGVAFESVNAPQVQ